MAQVDLAHSDVIPAALADNGAGGELHRTHYMLVISAVASVSIIVVAALFMSLF